MKILQHGAAAHMCPAGQYLPHAFGLTPSDAAQALSMEEDLVGALVGPLTHTPSQLANMVCVFLCLCNCREACAVLWSQCIHRRSSDSNFHFHKLWS